MPIDTVTDYIPKYALPLYTKITSPEMNDYTVGKEYEIRIDDPDRNEEKGGDGPYNYIHEVLLIGKREATWGELEALTLAFDAHTKRKDEAIDRIATSNSIRTDEEVVVLFFLRKDKTKEWIQSDAEVIEPPTTVEEYES